MNSSPYSHQNLGIMLRETRRQFALLLHLLAGGLSVAFCARNFFVVRVLFPY